MNIRAIVLAACAAFALAACGQTGEPAKGEAAGAPDPFDLNIEIGRYGVMLSQVHSLTGDRPDAAQLEVTDPRDLARRLRETVWEYNIERSGLCARGLFPELSCGAAYQPVWIGESSDTVPTIEEIAVRSRAVGEEVQRFWTAVCDDARANETDEEAREFLCAME